jgi:hypothetical protein
MTTSRLRTTSHDDNHKPNGSLYDMILQDKRSSGSWFYNREAFHSLAGPRSPGTYGKIPSMITETTQADVARAFGDFSADSCGNSISSATTVVSSLPRNNSMNDLDHGNEIASSKDSASQHTPVDIEAGGANDRNTGTSPLRKLYTQWFCDWWALEVGSMVLGTVCVVAIAGMLLRVDGREMPRWQLGFTIDLILSLLAGFSKSCLLMPTAEALGQLKWSLDKTDESRAIEMERIDRATRGKWGSMTLLIRSRGV